MSERDFWLLVLIGAFTYALVDLAQRVAYLEQDADRITAVRMFGPSSIQPLYSDRRRADEPAQ
jgi:hypothetical protein